MAEALWEIEPHTRAKHRVLRSYLEGWYPVMAQQAIRVRQSGTAIGAPRLMIVDGFAGPGRYAGGEPGSPIIMLEVLLNHGAFSRLSDVTFLFLFIEQNLRRIERLRQEVASLGSMPVNVKVRIEHGAFETTFQTVIDSVVEKGPAHRLVPTFAFIDPFGYSHASMSLTGRLLDFPRCEVLTFLPLSFVHRFVGREGQDAALTQLFGSEEWRNAVALEGEERRLFLLRLFERQLEARRTIEHVASFQLRTEDGNDYRLVFGLGHRKGLELAKAAMWKVDPERGTSYVATTETGQEVLFSPTVDTRPLLVELRRRFGRAMFSIEQAENVTLFETPFLPSHLRQRTLAPAVRDELLIVERPEGKSRGFVAGTKLRFAS